MINGRNDSNGMDPWLVEKDVVGEIKFQDLTCSFHRCGAYLKR